jgi:hypothetical protein
MRINEETLKEIIIRVIHQIKEESLNNTRLRKKKVYVIIDKNWEEKDNEFFKQLPNASRYEIDLVVPMFIKEKGFLAQWEKNNAGIHIITQEEANTQELLEYTTIFPKIPRDTLVKTALGISDTFETKWILQAFEKGQKIIMLQTGFDPLTGKEPRAYQERIKTYYKTLLEYGIDIRENLTLEEVSDDQAKTITKQIITEKEINQYMKTKKMEVSKQDIITELAKEKAHALGIQIIRM